MTIEDLRERCKELINNDKNKYKLILRILSNDDCFSNMDIETAYSILEDLNVKDIKKTYINLMKRK